jgi:hypothetical protein
MMSKTLHQFGRVLFDELEQIAVRRGGFASLKWTQNALSDAQRRVKKLRKVAAKLEAAKLKLDLPWLRKKAGECARQAKDGLALADQTSKAVDQLRQVISDSVRTAEEVSNKIKPPDQPLARERWNDRKHVVEARLFVLEELLKAAQRTLNVHGIRQQQNQVNNEARFVRICRLAWELKDLHQLPSELKRRDCDLAKQALKALAQAAGNCFKERGIYERLIRGAVLLLSDDLAHALKRADEELGRVIRAYQWMAKAKQVADGELGFLVAVQPPALRCEIYDIVEDAARKSAIRMGTVGLAFSGGGIRSATFNLGFLQGAAALGLLKQFDYLSTVSGGGYIGAWFAAWVLREGGGPGDPETAPEVDAKVKRTARALENVEMQLNSSRARQGGADRRWAPSDDIRDSREAIDPSLLLKRTVEDEPEPVHHLREHGNYLSPRLGLLSIDTWTMVSVYLRNLFLNQFIVLPMLLAVVALPRLVLFLFTHSTSGKTIDLAREWLNRNRVWPTATVFALALVACALVPKLTDFFAWRIVRRLHRRSVQWAFHSPLVLGMALVATLLVIFVLPSPVLANIGGIVQALDPRAWNPFVTGFVASVLIFLAAWFGPRINRRRAGDPERSAEPMPYEKVAAWWLLVVLIYGAALLSGWLPSVAPDFVESFVESLTGDSKWLTGDSALFLGTFAMASVGFYWTYESLAKIRPSPRPAPAVPAGHGLTNRVRWWRIWAPLLFILSGLGLGFLLRRPEWHYYGSPIYGAPILGTFVMALVGFWRTYNALAEIRRRAPPDHRMTKQMVRYRVVIPLICASLGVSLLFARPEKPFFAWPFDFLSDWFNPTKSGGMNYMPAVCFGGLVGLMRCWPSVVVNWSSRMPIARLPLRALSAFSSGLISGAGLAAVFSLLRVPAPESGPPDVEATMLAAVIMMSFGPALVMVAISAGSAIEVGLIGGYGQEDMREWRASIAASLMRIGTLWAALCVLSIYAPLFLWWARAWAVWAVGATLVVISVLGAMAGRSERTDGVKISKGPLEYLALIASAAFTVLLVVAVSVLVTYLQGVPIRPESTGKFLVQLGSGANPARTWAILLLSLIAAVAGCVHANINLFGLNAFYANRLVRCYLGATRPREAAKEGRPNYAPTNSPGQVRRPNPITGFDFDDDFPLHDLAIVRSWDNGDDLVVNYRGPYHLINTAMNLVAGDELAWQERMAESFVLSPLYCGSKTTGYRPATKIEKRELTDDEVAYWDWWRPPRKLMSGYGNNIRLGTATSVSGAAASPNAGYHSSPLVTMLMTILNARLGLWLGNPLHAGWRSTGPDFAFYFFDELFGLTTNRNKYIYLSDGGHFENLGAYELVRRRCRYIVVCDAGADPGLAFWDLGSLVRKCRQDLGVRIEIDVSPFLKKEGTPHAKWHCAVGQIHYENVDAEALPGMLIYIKPSLSGDEPSDVRNYLVGHPTFPHESTSNQFFNESQFESYRELGEHIALDVFGEVARDAGPDPSPAGLFATLRRRWVQATPNLDKGFLESLKPFFKIHQALRTDPKLEGLSHQLYRELEQPPRDGPGAAATTPPGDDRSHVHAVIEMLQAVQSAWIAMNLDVNCDQPLNAGWMNVFRRWISSGIFQAYWPAVRGEFSEGFIRFCETELNLTVQKPEFAWLRGYPNKNGRTIGLRKFKKALRELDKEFLLEWPRVVRHEISDDRCGLAEMFEHACKHPTGARGRPMAVLILRDETVHGRRPASKHSPAGEARSERRPTSAPSYYGVILAWGSSEGVVELVLWLRGAYATLAIGEAIEKTIRDFKEELKALKPEGYALRTRYPSDDRNRGKQRWRRTVWTDFFRNQGFCRDDSDNAINSPDILIYRSEPR